MSKIRTGLLSFGLSGKVFHAPFLNAHEGFLFTSVTERSKKEACQTYPDVTSYDSVDQLVANPNIELVIINTPNYTHYDFALKALKANKHVLIEKPFTTNTEQAIELFDRAKRNKLHVLPYQNRRYDSDFLSVKKTIESGVLGNLIEAHFRFDRYRIQIGPKAAKETTVPGSGIAYDLGPHLLDQVIYLFGNPVSWKKTLGHFRPNSQVDDYARIDLEFPNNLQVCLTMSMLVADPQPAFILHGSKGSFVKHRANRQEEQLIGGMDLHDVTFGSERSADVGHLTTFRTDKTKIRQEVVSTPSSYMKLFDDVFNTIRHEKAFPITTPQILKQIEILAS